MYVENVYFHFYWEQEESLVSGKSTEMKFIRKIKVSFVTFWRKETQNLIFCRIKTFNVHSSVVKFPLQFRQNVLFDCTISLSISTHFVKTQIKHSNKFKCCNIEFCNWVSTHFIQLMGFELAVTDSIRYT